MRALVVGEYAPLDRLEISDAPVPEPGEGEVLIRVAAVGLGFVDGLKVQGKYQTKDPLPFVPGSEIAGVVEAVGPGAGLRTGDRVTANVSRGGLAEYAVAPAAATEVLPDAVSFAVAAAVRVNYLTALFALRHRAEARPGETLLVLGAAGGTGTAAIAVGRLLGLRVLAGASTEDKRQYAVRAGADEAVDTADPGWRAALKERGLDVDVIFDPVGGALGEEAFRALAWRGRHLVIGFASGDIPSARYNIALLKGASLVGVDIAQVQRREPETWQQMNAQIATWLASGELNPAIDDLVDLDDVGEAFRRMAERRAVGKVVVRVADIDATHRK
ncbi:NADPH:quinone oxidoreductase family protein [Cumulibacter manganitolerans]|uniref:NADPH:quinone oxidoreductase family protein n=1 Tax=Cumulibacter manganitolerans TaxID=1884992 RepID=UPI001294F546|nr:NADPH:quinone oxidoreductase family protein [Cumulibacter manganitolerans]